MAWVVISTGVKRGMSRPVNEAALSWLPSGDFSIKGPLGREVCGRCSSRSEFEAVRTIAIFCCSLYSSAVRNDRWRGIFVLNLTR